MGLHYFGLCLVGWVLSTLTIKAQQSYDPFQYGKAPNPIQAPTVSSLEHMRTQQQIAIQQQNYQQMIKMGMTPPPTQTEIALEQQRLLQGKQPELTPQMKMQKELIELLKESQHNNAVVTQQDYYKSVQYLNDLPNYTKARDVIRDMLEGRKLLSIKDAYYMAESAYGNLQLSYEEYTTLIAKNATYILQWIKENGYDAKDPEALHLGIQKFMSDTLTIHVNGQKQRHLPYIYDYLDALSEKNRNDYFVTKTLSTGSGQCHTLPTTYLILAEALGVETSLAYNPQHSFIRYANNKGTIVNYETTIDRFLPDAFYLQTMPVMATAQKNKLYIYSLTKRQVVASVLFDMAVSFIQEHWLGNKEFVKECMDIATPYFPNQEFINSACNYLHKRLLADAFNNKVQEKGIRDMKQIEQYPDVLEAYQAYYGYMEKLQSLGVQDFPESEYLRMLQYYDEKKKIQMAKNVQAKTKKTLFIN